MWKFFSMTLLEVFATWGSKMLIQHAGKWATPMPLLSRLWTTSKTILLCCMLCTLIGHTGYVHIEHSCGYSIEHSCGREVSIQ